MFDAPIHRDRLAWLVLCWFGVNTLIFIANAAADKGTPWFAGETASVAFVVIVGIAPPGIRSLMRAASGRRRARSG
ncbi:MAG TPA: hypothetical protein VGX23_11400 [Actinocrinis sp.]|nr:hypothetical protein [Actinocrinis sp.]